MKKQTEGNASTMLIAYVFLILCLRFVRSENSGPWKHHEHLQGTQVGGARPLRCHGGAEYIRPGSLADCLDSESGRSLEAASPPQERDHHQLSIQTEGNQLYSDVGSATVQLEGNLDSTIVNISCLESMIERFGRSDISALQAEGMETALTNDTSYLEGSRSTPLIAREEEIMYMDADAYNGTQHSRSLLCRRLKRNQFNYHMDLEGETSSEAGASSPRIHGGNRTIAGGGADMREIRVQQQVSFHIEVNLSSNHHILLMQPLMTERFRVTEIPLESTNELRWVNMIPQTSGGAQLTYAGLHSRQRTTLGNSQGLEICETPSEGGAAAAPQERDQHRSMSNNYYKGCAVSMLMGLIQLGGLRPADFAIDKVLPTSCYIAFASVTLVLSLLLIFRRALSDCQRTAMVVVCLLLLFLNYSIIKPFYLPSN